VVRADHVGLGGDVELEILDPAAGLGVPKALRVERRPVADAAVQIPDVHEVEVVGGPGPQQLRIVDLESTVRGHPGGLDGGDVCADYIGRGELVGEVAGTRGQWGCDCERELVRAYIAHMPVPVPTSKTFYGKR